MRAYLASGPGWSVESVSLDRPLRPSAMACQPGAPARHWVIRDGNGWVLGTCGSVAELAELARVVPLPELAEALR